MYLKSSNTSEYICINVLFKNIEKHLIFFTYT